MSPSTVAWIVLFLVSSVSSQGDPCNFIFKDLPYECSCRHWMLTCRGLNSNNIYKLNRVLESQRNGLKFQEIQLTDFDLNHLPSDAFRNIDTEYLRLENGQFLMDNKTSRSFLNLFPSLKDLVISDVEAVGSKGNWHNFLPVEKDNLEHLSIIRSDFSQVWETFPWTISRNLVKLELINTSITDLYSFVCYNCRFIEISNGALERIENDAFRFTPKLQVLKLNDNKLQDLPTYIFGSLHEDFQYLDLSGNQLTSLSPSIFNNLPLHTRINLTGQLLNCDCNYSWLLDYYYYYFTYPDCFERGYRRNMDSYLWQHCYGTTITTEDYHSSVRPDLTTPDQWHTNDDSSKGHTDDYRSTPGNWHTNDDSSTPGNWHTNDDSSTPNKRHTDDNSDRSTPLDHHDTKTHFDLSSTIEFHPSDTTEPRNAYSNK